MDLNGEFQGLALTHLDSLYGYARLLSRNEPEAQDLLQETLLRAFRAFGSYKRDLSFHVWVFTIMRHQSLDWLRRRRVRSIEEDRRAGGSRARVGEDDLWFSAVPLDPEEILIRNLTTADVRQAIKRLPPVLREVVELREIEGLSYQVIARVIGRPVGTVMSRLYRGRNLLRSLLQDPSTQGVAPRRGYGV